MNTPPGTKRPTFDRSENFKMDIKLTSGSISAEFTLPDTTHLASVEGTGITALADALLTPLGLPQLCQCSVPGDRIVIAVDPNTPQVAATINTVWEELHGSDLTELNITVLLPSDATGNEWKQLIEELPVHVRNQAAIHIHDPVDESKRHYLASSAGGERIYLSQHLVDADLIITVGTIAFDPLLGYRGTNSAIFPALSDTDTIKKFHGTGHSELTPDDKRPVRELMEEVGWLLGTQFAVQVIPDSQGVIAFAFCGLPDQVMEAGKTCLSEHWTVCLEDSLELAVISVSPSMPQFGWKQLGTALEAVTRVVEDDGRIVVVADLPAPDSPAFQMLRRCSEPADLVKPLNLEPTHDAVEIIQLIKALGRFRVYVMSGLPADVVEDMGMLAVANEAELQRIVSSSERSAVIHGANSAWLQT